MKLMSLKQFEKKSRGSLMRFINGYLKTQSKKQIAIFAYTLAKSKLPRLKTIRQKALPKRKIEELEERIERLRTPSPVSWDKRRKSIKKLEGKIGRSRKRKTKRKFSRKQLAAQRLFAKRARAGTLRR